MYFGFKSAPKMNTDSCFLSPVRRIGRLAVNGRFCAMVFDGGPCRLPPAPDRFRGKPLTIVLAETLERYGAKGTFAVTGDTSGNYPDRPGRSGSPSWCGTNFDHCPDFGMDHQGGAVNCPELITRLLAGGHEIASNSYALRLFGWEPLMQGFRRSLPSLNAVLDDLRRLHKVLEDGWGYPIRLSRPPRGVDNIKNGFSSFDAYALLGYQYLSASFDGGGRMPMKTYEEEVEAVWRPMERLLLEDPDALRGHIISLRDGFSMTRRTPAADGLERQLRLLSDQGYQVVTVSELLELAPFQDFGLDTPTGRAAHKLLRLGWCVACQDNALRPDAILTRGELAMMAFGWETVRRRIELICGGRAPFRDMAPRDPYAAAAMRAVETGAMSAVNGAFRPGDPISPVELAQFCAVRLGRLPPLGNWAALRRGDFFAIAAGLTERE